MDFGCDTQNQPLAETMPAPVEATPPLPGLSPVGGKSLIARVDGGRLDTSKNLLIGRW